MNPTLFSPITASRLPRAVAHNTGRPVVACHWLATRGALLLVGLLLATLVAHAQLTVQDGLALWLKADAGVTTEGTGTVTYWADQSPNANDAAPRWDGTPDERPVQVMDVVGGKPAIRFDGIDDVLEVYNSPSLQPMEGSWTVFFVAKRLAASQGDYPPVIGSRAWQTGSDNGWGVSFASGGVVASHLADGSTGHDLPAVGSNARLSQDSFEIWQVEEHREAGTTSFYRNFDLDRQLVTSMPVGTVNQIEFVYLGRDMDGSNNRRANMDLAEVLVYNRALSPSERNSVASYLNAAYSLGFTLNVAPTVSLTSPSPGLSVDVPATVTLTAVAEDTDGTIRQVAFYESGSLLATASAPPYSVAVSLQSIGALSFTAVATDDRGGFTTSTAVPVTATGSVTPPDMTVSAGLQLWLKADDGVSAGGTGDVSVWQDRSPNGNSATQDDALAFPPDSYQPTLLANALGGKPVVRFDGVDDFMHIPNSASLQPQNGDWTVLFVGKRAGSSRGDYPQIIGSRPWTAGLDEGWAVVFNQNGFVGSHYADGTAGHDVAEALSMSPFAQDAYQLWQVEENRNAALTRYFLNGQMNRTVATAMPAEAIDQLNDIYLGSETEGSDSRRANLDLAELLVYSRVLTDADRASVNDYLLLKYSLKQIFSLNEAPTVDLVSPAADSVFNAPAPIALEAAVEDSDGTVTQVEFFLGTRSLGVVTESPFRLNVTVTSLGAADLTVVATDNFGARSTSDPVPIRVVAKDVILIGEVDYSDTFTLDAVRTVGLYNDNANGAYRVEDSHGNTAATWTPTSSFSFNSPASSTDPARVGAATGNSGAATGLAQSGGGDFSLTYGLRSNYVVQLNAILPADRLDITSLPTAGGGIFAPNSLTVFLRRDTATSLPGIGLFNGAMETAVTDAGGAFVRTGVADDDWHTFAIHVDQPNSVLRVYVDGVLIATVNLATFADGAYQSFSNGAVGVGGVGGVFWLDNFKVGAPPELIRTVDYSDTFTLSENRYDGLYDDNSLGGYDIEESRGNPLVTWTPTSGFRFITLDTSADPERLYAAIGNAGAVTGLAQWSGGDFSIGYGLRSDYVVQMDVILPTDRFDITSLDTPGGGILGVNKLSVFFRLDSTAGTPHAAFPDTGLPAIGLYNGSTESAVTDPAGNLIFSGVDDDNWHNFAVHFNQPAHELGIYVDRILKATVDLATFAGGMYDVYSNAAVGMGGGTFGGGTFWMDNFKVGEPEPQATAPAGLLIQQQLGKIMISWTGSGTLEEANEINGSWNPVSNPSNPYSVAPAAGHKFYRLKQ